MANNNLAQYYLGDSGTERQWQQCRYCHCYVEGPAGQPLVTKHNGTCPVADLEALYLSPEIVAKQERRVADLIVALDESLKLQSHYAELLNMHDGGQRKGFKNTAEWIARLRVTRVLPD